MFGSYAVPFFFFARIKNRHIRTFRSSRGMFSIYLSSFSAYRYPFQMLMPYLVFFSVFSGCFDSKKSWMSLVISPLLLTFLKLMWLIDADTGSFSRKFNSSV